MAVLRSTSVHHIDEATWSLLDYALTLGPEEQSFVNPYTRPHYDVFQQHCQKTISSAGLADVFCQADVQSIHRQGDVYRLETDGDSRLALNVILCPGPTAPAVPVWAKEAQLSGESMTHLFEMSQASEIFEIGSQVAVVGGGMSGVQFAIAMASRQCKVTLVRRHPLKVHDFDADPCWVGPKCLNSDFHLASLGSRREQISQARLKGSVNNEVFQEWRGLVVEGKVREIEAEAVGLSRGTLHLSDGSFLDCDRVVLATGFEPGLPGGALVRQMIEDLALPVAPCGFPILSERLEWSKGLYVSGDLAELTVGPVARNIAGARAASKRILGRPGGRFRRVNPKWQIWRG
jgi:hypothetical protein